MTKKITTFNLDIEDIKKLDIISEILKKSRSRILSEFIKSMSLEQAKEKLEEIENETNLLKKDLESLQS